MALFSLNTGTGMRNEKDTNTRDKKGKSRLYQLKKAIANNTYFEIFFYYR